MSQSSIFPVYIKTQYDGSGGAFDQLTREVARAADEARKTFERSFSGFKSGASNLSVDLPGLRKTAADAEYAAQRVDALRVAAINLSRATGDKTNATVQYIKALSDQSVEADRALRIANAEVTTHERLQAEIEKTITSNAKLAQSYRNTFLEQAKAENAAYRFQQGINAAVAPALSRKATDNGAGFGALASMAREQEAAKRLQNELDVLRRAEVGAAEGARILEAAHRGTALASDHAAKSARDSAAAFEAAFSARAAAALKAQERATEEAAAAARKYATDLELVKRAIDPTRVAQQQLDAELARADVAFEKGAIDARQYGLAVNAAANNFEGMVTGVRRGTDAWGIHANSMRGSRQAMVQTGQQLQDVVISLAGGQRASTALAQQLPQLAFALSGVGGRVGAVATALSGPWGLALVGASFVLGGFIDKLLETDKAAGKAGDAQEELASKLSIAKHGFEDATKAAADYNAEQAKVGRLAQDRLITERNEADTSLKAARDNASRLEAEIRNTPKGLSGKKGVLEVELAKARGEIAQWETTLRSTTGALAEEFAKIATDDRYAIEERFKRLRTEAKNAGGDVAAVAAKLAALDKQETASLAKLDKRKDRASSDGVPRFKSREDAIGIAGDELRQFGFRVSENEQFGGVRANHPGMGNAAHGKYAIDVNAGLGVNEASVPDLKAKLDALALDYQQRGYRVLWNGKVYEAGGNGPGGSIKSGPQHSDHMHVEAPSTIIGKATQRGSTRAINAEFERLDDLTKLGADASRAIAGINSKWDDQPRLVDQASAATAELGSIIAAITESKPPNWQEMVKQAEAAQISIATFIDRDIAKWIEQSQRGVEIQSLLLSGYEDEAAVVQAIWRAREKYGDLTARQSAEISAQVLAEQELTREIAKRQELQSAYLDTTRTIRGEVESLFSGRGFDLKRISQTFLDLQGKIITERLFGDTFRELDKWVKKETGLDDAVTRMATETGRAGGAAGNLADALDMAAGRIRGTGGAQGDTLLADFDAAFASRSSAQWDPLFAKLAAAGAANDNPEIVAAAARKAAKGTVNALSPVDYFTQLRKSMAAGLESSFGPASGPLAGALTGYATAGKAGGALGLLSSLGLGKTSTKAGDALKGLQTGKLLSGAFGLDSTGSDIGGVIGSVIPGIGSLGGAALGGLLGKGGGVTKGAALGAIGLTGYAALASGGGIASSAMLGTALGVPVIALGAIVGALIATIFKKAKTGSASVSNGAVSLGGNNAERRDKLGSAAGGISDSLAGIAAQLGGTLGDYGYSIGVRKDEYRVSGSAGANVTSKNPGGLIYKGKDGEEAARIALLNAIQDGAIAGIRAGAQRLLASGKDLEGQVQKALSFQSIFDRLQAYEDPMGYALGKLDREFANLRSIATEAGEGMLETERLYAIERAKVIEETNKRVTASLRDLYDTLTAGSDARSLGERRAYTLATYDPLAARVAAGDKAAYDDFAAAAQSLLDIERQIFGSQSGYFSRLDEITSLTKTRIDAESNVASISSDRPGIFTPTVANDNVPVVNSIDAQTNAIVSIGNQTNALLADLLSKWNGTIGMQVAAGNYF